MARLIRLAYDEETPMPNNGQVTDPKVAEMLAEEVTDTPRQVLDPSQLTIRDLKRARATVLDGRDPFEVLNEPLDAAVLTIWCLRSRTDPSFTWDQAEDTPLGDFELAGEAPPPPAPGPTPSGPGPDAAEEKSSRARRRSATSTG